MSSDPTNIGLLGHRWGVYLRNHAETNEIWVDRVQNVEPTFNAPTTKQFELGRIAPVGTIQEPTDFRVTMEENLHNCEADSILANGTGSPGASFSAADMVATSAARLCLVGRDVGATNPSLEYVLGNLAVAEVRYRFQIGGPCTVTYTLEGRAGNLYTTGSLTHTTCGTGETTSPGGINGKDARIYFGAGTTVPSNSQVYRLQSFDLRIAFPVQTVRELGRRAMVGKLADSPDVTLDFDLLAADRQPHDVWAALVGTGYDFTNLNRTNVFIRVYDPSLTEASTILKGFRVENVRATTGTMTRAQVRQLATVRYSLTSESEATADTAGVIIFPGDIS